MKVSLRSVDHLHPCCPCLAYRASNESSIHPLRGASLRSAPRSSRQERIAFPICWPCLARLYLACPQGSPREATEKIPRSPREAPEKHQRGSRGGPQRGPRGAPPRAQKRPCFGTRCSAKMYVFSLVLQQQQKPVIARTGSAPEEFIRNTA